MKCLKIMKTMGLAALLFAASSAQAVGWVLPGVDISSDAATFAGDTPQIAVDPSGNAVAVWRETTDALTTSFIQAATRPFGGSWTAPVTISATGGTRAFPMVAVDASGNATAVWENNVAGPLDTIEYADLPFGGVWSAAATLAPAAAANFQNPQIALDPAGNAIAAWRNATTGAIKAATRLVGGAWVNTADPSTGAGNQLLTNTKQLGVDAAGNGYLTWDNSSISGSAAFFAYLPFGAGIWQNEGTIPLSPGMTTIRGGAIDVNAAGQAVFALAGSDGITTRAVGAFRPVGGPLGAGVFVSDFALNVTSFGDSAAIDSAGNATVVWSQTNGVRQNIFASTRDVSTGVWSTPAMLSLDTLGNSLEPSVATNETGDVFAVWMKDSGGAIDLVEGNNKPFGFDWQAAPTTLSSVGATTGAFANAPNVAVDPSGNATAIWVRDNSGVGAGLTVIQSTQFFEPTASGTRIKNRFATQTEYIDRLTFEATPGAASYEILLGTQVLGTVSAAGPYTFDVHQRAKGASYTYQIAALDGTGNAITQVMVTVSAAASTSLSSSSSSSSN